MTNTHRHSSHSQRGAATLVTSLILLLGITLVAFSSARVGVVEQRIAANDYRAKQALHAAQAALEQAVYSSNVTAPALSPSYTRGTLSGVTTTTAPCTTAGLCYQYAYESILSPSSSAALKITATGWSDDGSATKTVLQSIKLYSPLSSIPDKPVQSGGHYGSDSNSVAITNPEGGVVIAAQGAVDTGGKEVAFIETTNPDGTITTTPATTDNGGLATTRTDGVTDVVDTAAEGEAFFQSIFGSSKAEIQSLSLPVTCSGVCNSSLVNTGVVTSGNTITDYGTPKAPFIWVTGNTTINSSTVIGSPDNPVVLVVDGSLTINGGATIHGFVYSTGATTSTETVLAGTATIVGSVISEGNLSAAGNLTIRYSSYPDRPGPKGPVFYVKIPGTWIDQ